MSEAIHDPPHLPIPRQQRHVTESSKFVMEVNIINQGDNGDPQTLA